MLLQKITVDQAFEVVGPGPSRWVLWLWAWATIVTGACYIVTGGGMLQLPVLASYTLEANFAPLMLFWALTAAGEIVDATIMRRPWRGARLSASLFTTIVFIGADLTLLSILLPLERAGWEGKVLDPFLGLVIVPFVVLMVLAPLPAALVNWAQAVACPDPRRTDMLLAVAGLHWFPLLYAIILVAAPGVEAIETRVVAGAAMAIGFVLARLLRVKRPERTAGQ